MADNATPRSSNEMSPKRTARRRASAKRASTKKTTKKVAKKVSKKTTRRTTARATARNTTPAADSTPVESNEGAAVDAADVALEQTAMSGGAPEDDIRTSRKAPTYLPTRARHLKQHHYVVAAAVFGLLSVTGASAYYGMTDTGVIDVDSVVAEREQRRNQAEQRSGESATAAADRTAQEAEGDDAETTTVPKQTRTPTIRSGALQVSSAKAQPRKTPAAAPVTASSTSTSTSPDTASSTAGSATSTTEAADTSTNTSAATSSESQSATTTSTAS